MIIRIQMGSVPFPRSQDVFPATRPAALAAATLCAPAALVFFTMTALAATGHMMAQSRMAEGRWLLTTPAELPRFWVRWGAGVFGKYAAMTSILALCSYLLTWLSGPFEAMEKKTADSTLRLGLPSVYSPSLARRETLGT